MPGWTMELRTPEFLLEAAYIQWIAGIKETTSSSNWLPIESRWKNWVLPVIGKKRIEDLTEQKLQGIVNQAYAGGLSKKTLTSLCWDDVYVAKRFQAAAPASTSRRKK